MTTPCKPPLRAAAIAALLATATAASAAIVDIDYDQIRDQPLGASLLTEMKIDIPGSTFEYAGSLKRVRVLWDDPSAGGPLLIGAKGLPVPAMRDALSGTGAAPLATTAGQALPLPRDPRYAVLPLADDEVVMGTKKGLDGFAPSPWPAPTGIAVSFTGFPKDINLPEYGDRVSDFSVTMTKDGLLTGKINCNDRATARGLMSYIANRLPLLDVAAAVGVEKAKFPKKMIDAAVIERTGQVINITVDLSKDAALRSEAHEFLIKTLRRRMKKAA